MLWLVTPRVCFAPLTGCGPWAFCAGGPGAEGFEGPEWKKVSAKRFGIEESMIPAEAWNVLHRLRSRGATVLGLDGLPVFGLFVVVSLEFSLLKLGFSPRSND